jgi:hypothetical protein
MAIWPSQISKKEGNERYENEDRLASASKKPPVKTLSISVQQPKRYI